MRNWLATLGLLRPVPRLDMLPPMRRRPTVATLRRPYRLTWLAWKDARLAQLAHLHLVTVPPGLTRQKRPPPPNNLGFR